MLITGKPEEVIIAQALVWDNLALQGCEEGFGKCIYHINIFWKTIKVQLILILKFYRLHTQLSCPVMLSPQDNILHVRSVCKCSSLCIRPNMLIEISYLNIATIYQYLHMFSVAFVRTFQANISSSLCLSYPLILFVPDNLYLYVYLNYSFYLPSFC